MYHYIYSDKKLKIDDKYLDRKYKYINLLYSMINELKSKNKDIIFISIPELEGLKQSKSKIIIIDKELEYISKKYNCKYINGYQLLSNTSSKKLESLFLHHDGHWSDLGVEEFTNQLIDSSSLFTN